MIDFYGYIAQFRLGSRAIKRLIASIITEQWRGFSSKLLSIEWLQTLRGSEQYFGNFTHCIVVLIGGIAYLKSTVVHIKTNLPLWAKKQTISATHILSGCGLPYIIMMPGKIIRYTKQYRRTEALQEVYHELLN